MSCKNMDYREFKKETHCLTPLGLMLAKHIRFHANSIGVCWERHKTMAEETNLCQRTIRCHLRELVDAMILVAFPRHRSDGGWTSSEYVLLAGNRDAGQALESAATTCGVMLKDAIRILEKTLHRMEKQGIDQWHELPNKISTLIITLKEKEKEKEEEKATCGARSATPLPTVDASSLSSLKDGKQPAMGARPWLEHLTRLTQETRQPAEALNTTVAPSRQPGSATPLSAAGPQPPTPQPVTLPLSILTDMKTHWNQLRETYPGGQPWHDMETWNTIGRLLKNRGDITMSTLLAAARHYKHECATKPGFDPTFQLGAVRFFETGAWENHVTLEKHLPDDREMARQFDRLHVFDKLKDRAQWFRQLFVQECSRHLSDPYDANADRAMSRALKAVSLVENNGQTATA